MTASNGLIQNIIASTPTIVSKRRDDLREALLQRVGDVVDVVRDTAEDVAAGVGVEVLERQPAELLVDLASQTVHGPL